MARKKFILVCYDIVDDQARNKTSALLEEFGIRVNYSVFECMLSESELRKLMVQIELRLNLKTDKVFYYTVCMDCFTKIKKQPSQNNKAPLVLIS
ncbi:MAG: CRISPR-associated endonuclease Cas2 [bacterium]|nr:CRISPR-associated endonuclease Cas2 [bacterium]